MICFWETSYICFGFCLALPFVWEMSKREKVIAKKVDVWKQVIRRRYLPDLMSLGICGSCCNGLEKRLQELIAKISLKIQKYTLFLVESIQHNLEIVFTIERSYYLAFRKFYFPCFAKCCMMRKFFPAYSSYHSVYYLKECLYSLAW